MSESERWTIVDTSVKRTAEAAMVLGVAGKPFVERAGKSTDVFLRMQAQKVLNRRQRK